MSRRDPQTASAVILAIEIEQSVDREGWRYKVTISRAGREGTFTKEWPAPQGRLSASQARDLCGWVTTSAEQALVVWGGVQTELDVR